MFSLVTFKDKRLDRRTLFMAILMLSYARRWRKLIPLKSSLGKNICVCEFKYLAEYFNRSERPGCQNLRLCIPFWNQKVILEWNKRLLFHAL